MQMPKKKSKKTVTKKPKEAVKITSLSSTSNRLSLIDTDHLTPSAMNQGNLSHKLKIEMLKRKLKGRG